MVLCGTRNIKQKIVQNVRRPEDEHLDKHLCLLLLQKLLRPVTSGGCFSLPHLHASVHCLLLYLKTRSEATDPGRDPPQIPDCRWMMWPQRCMELLGGLTWGTAEVQKSVSAASKILVYQGSR